MKLVKVLINLFIIAPIKIALFILSLPIMLLLAFSGYGNIAEEWMNFCFEYKI